MTQQPRQPGRRSSYDNGYQPSFTPAPGAPAPGAPVQGDPRVTGYPDQPGYAEAPGGHPRPEDRPRPAPGPRAAQRDVEDDEVPAWAGLGPEGRAPSRGDMSAARRKKRRLITIGAAVVVVAAAVGGYVAFSGHAGPANVVSNDLITTFLPGELQQVPNSCGAVPSATMSQYMPGKLKSAAPPLNSGLNSQCTWTLDNPPTYRVLEVDLQAYSPSGLASGDGSATFAAIDAFEEAQTSKTNPGKNSGEPDAALTTFKVSGNNAFQAVQVYHSTSATMYVVTEVIRYRNVLITTVVDGLQESTGTKHYGPVSESTLTAEGQAAAQGATTKVMG